MASTSAAARALFTGSCLSGVMMSLSLIAVPVLLDTTTYVPQLLHQWTRMYHYGHQALPTMAVCTSLLYLYTASKKRRVGKSGALLILAAVTTVSMLPFTWLMMVPTNNEIFRLQQASLTDVEVIGVIEARELIEKWLWLHSLRSFLPLVGGAMLGSIAIFRG